MTASTVTASQDLASQQEVLGLVQEYLDALGASVERHWEDAGYRHQKPVFSFEPGRKYIKIVKDTGSQKMVHSFVDKRTGEVYKAAGWSAPAKGVRFNLAEASSKEEMFTKMDIHGSYLYL